MTESGRSPCTMSATVDALRSGTLEQASRIWMRNRDHTNITEAKALSANTKRSTRDSLRQIIATRSDGVGRVTKCEEQLTRKSGVGTRWAQTLLWRSQEQQHCSKHKWTQIPVDYKECDRKVPWGRAHHIASEGKNKVAPGPVCGTGRRNASNMGRVLRV